MSLENKLISITNMIKGSFLFFFAILILYIFYPIIDNITALFAGNTLFQAVITIILGLVIFLFSMFIPWKVFFSKNDNEKI